MKRSRTISWLMLACIPITAQAAEPENDENAEKKVVSKIERLLGAKKTSQAMKTATGHFGEAKSWCDVSKVGDPTGVRTYGALGVLARRSKLHDVAARCAVATISTATTRDGASAGYFELSLVEPKLSDKALVSVLAASASCPLFRVDLVDERDDLKEALDSKDKKRIAKARKSTRTEIIRQAVKLWPSAGAARQMTRVGVSPQIMRDAIGRDAPREVVIRGPFPNANAAEKAMRREGEMDRDKRKPVQPKKPAKGAAKGAWKAEMDTVTTDDGCTIHHFMSLVRGKSHYYVPLGYDTYDTGECGGYGEEAEAHVKWPIKQKVTRGTFKEESYINTECGPATSSNLNEVFCDVTGAKPVCVGAFAESRGRMGEEGPDLNYWFGSTADIDAKGLLDFESNGPKPIQEALDNLGETTIPAAAKTLKPTLDALSTKLTKPKK